METLELGPLPCFRPDPVRWLWWVGAHGGAGESTLADLMPASGAADHQWPLGGTVVLVARTNARGLLAAQAALRTLASPGRPDVDLLGLVLSSDAPGRLPNELDALARLVVGGAPRCWFLPFIREWRTGGRADPASTKRLFADIATLTAPKEIS